MYTQEVYYYNINYSCSLQIVCVCAMVYSLCAATILWSGVMLHHAQVPHRPCHGRLPLPFGLQHTKTTRPWQPINPVLDQLLFTFLFRLPVNSDPLGLTFDHPMTWCSSPSTAELDDDIGHDTSTSDESSSESMETGCVNDLNSSSQAGQHGRDRLQEDVDKELDETLSDDFKQGVARVNSIQEALLIFYHALISALWEVEEVAGKVGQDSLEAVNINKNESDMEANNVTSRKPKRSCPYRRNIMMKSSQHKMNTTANTFTHQSQVESLPDEVPSTDDADASDTRKWDSHGVPEGSHE